MDLFYSENLRGNDGEMVLSPEEGHHCRHVMRKCVGDRILLTDGNGFRAEAVIRLFRGAKVTCEILSGETVPPPRSRAVQVALSPIRPRRMDWAMEKLTELGVGKIIPILCEHSSIGLIKKKHLNRIAISALKQSGQFYLPEIAEPCLLNDWLDDLPPDESALRLIAHPVNAGLTPLEPANFQHGIILIGPEGGFSETEVSRARECRFQPVRLSQSILRSETAAVAGAFLLLSIFNGTYFKL